jgi:hypothetical protein
MFWVIDLLLINLDLEMNTLNFKMKWEMGRIQGNSSYDK